MIPDDMPGRWELRPVLPAILLGITGNSAPIVHPMLVNVVVSGYGLSASQAGFVSALEMTVFGIGAFIVVGLLGRVSLRTIGTAAIILAAVGNLLSILAQEVEWLILARAVAGLGAGGTLAASGALIARLPSPDRMYSLAVVSMLLYAAAFLTFVPRLMETYGAAMPFVAMFAVALATLPAALWIPRTEHRANARAKLPIRPGHVAPLLLAALLLYAGHGAVWTYQERMGAEIGMSLREIGNALGAASLAGIAGAALAGALGTRFGRTLPQVAALLLSICAALLIVNATDAASYRLAAIMIAASWFFGLPYFNGLAASVDREGRVAAALAATLNVGNALGPFIGALVVSRSGLPMVGWVAAIAYLGCLLLILPTSMKHDSTLSGRKSKVPA